jgi:hypothetical protein
MVAGAVATSMAVVAIPSAHAGEAARAAGHVATAAGPALSGEARALARARSTGRPVPVPGDTTATDTVTANPKGTLTLSRSLIPVRKWVNGAWRPLNATLRRSADGSISTVLSTGGLALSGGGTGPMVTLRALGKVLAVSFPVPLPLNAGSFITGLLSSVF